MHRRRVWVSSAHRSGFQIFAEQSVGFVWFFFFQDQSRGAIKFLANVSRRVLLPRFRDGEQAIGLAVLRGVIADVVDQVRRLGGGQSLIEFGVGGGEIFFLAAAIPCRVVTFASIHGRQRGDFGLGLIFSAAGDSWSGAIIFNQGLVGGEIVRVQLDGGFEFLLRFFGERQRREPGSTRGFFSQGAAEPFMIDGIIGSDRQGFFRTAGGGIVLLQLEVTLGQQ